MSRTLFDIGESELALYEALAEAGGELDEPLEKWFAELGAEREKKLNSIGWLIRQLEGDISIRRTEIDRLTRASEVDTNVITRIKARLKSYLTLIREKKVKTDHFTISEVGNGGQCPVMLSEYAKAHPEELGERYNRVTFEPNLSNIREDLERLRSLGSKPQFETEDEQEEFDVLSLALEGVAVLGERGSHIRIK